MRLITAGNPNLATIESVLVVAQKYFKEAITDVFFIDTDGSTVGRDGKSIAGHRIEIVQQHTNPAVKIGQQYLSDSSLAVGIPRVLTELIRAAESVDDIVLDLTNGTKAISSLLYAAGSLLQIRRLLFITITDIGRKRKAADLDEGDFWVQQIDPLENLHELGQLAFFDLIYYKNLISTITHLYNQTAEKPTEVELEAELMNAVQAYFRSDLKSSIMAVGRVAEYISKHVLLTIKSTARGKFTSSVPNLHADRITFLSSQFCEPLRGKLGRAEELLDYEKELIALRNIDIFLNLLRVLRNDCAHPRLTITSRIEAKLALDIIINALETIGNIYDKH